MERDEFLRGMEDAAERLRVRVASVHERVACPKCGAPVGQLCRSMPRGWRPLDLPGAGARVLKHSHPNRLRADGIPDR